MLASKIWDDNSMRNYDFGTLFELIPLDIINKLEYKILLIFNFNINVNVSEYTKYDQLLISMTKEGKFQNILHKIVLQESNYIKNSKDVNVDDDLDKQMIIPQSLCQMSLPSIQARSNMQIGSEYSEEYKTKDMKSNKENDSVLLPPKKVKSQYSKKEPCWFLKYLICCGRHTSTNATVSVIDESKDVHLNEENDSTHIESKSIPTSIQSSQNIISDYDISSQPEIQRFPSREIDREDTVSVLYV
jgi:hypothetical protein